jgi:citrate synthase
VIAGISALEGIRHGGLAVRVESMLESMRRERTGRAAVAERLRQGAEISGFGHPLYPDEDPRAAELFRLLRARYPKSAELSFALDVAAAANKTLDQRPTLDFALATVSRVLGLPPRSGLTLFAIGRTIGWIGHAIEQYATGTLIRPRARYVPAAP